MQLTRPKAQSITHRPQAVAVTPSYRRLLGFLAPLLFTGAMMTLDTPFVNAVLTRLPGAEAALAALVVAFSLAMVYEAPHVSMTEVATALATTRQALALLRRFYAGLALVLLVVGIAVVASPLYDVLVQEAMGIPSTVAAAARPTLAVFLFWPLPIGWRRLHQGALIRHGHSRAVGAGATVRLAGLALSLLGGFTLFGGQIGGSTIGALAMLGSVTAEAAYTDLAARRLLGGLPAAAPGVPLTLWALWEVFWPLVGTTTLNTLNRPLLAMGIAAAGAAAGGAVAGEAALAAWGVGWGVVMLVNGATLLLSQVAITWEAGPRFDARRATRVLLGTGLGLSALIALIAFTPLADWLLGQIYAAPPALATMARPVLQWLVLVPVLAATSALFRGRLIARRAARAVRTAQVADLLVMGAVLALGIAWPLPGPRPGGALLGAGATLAVLLTDALVLGWQLRHTPALTAER